MVLATLEQLQLLRILLQLQQDAGGENRKDTKIQICMLMFGSRALVFLDGCSRLSVGCLELSDGAWI